MNTSQAPNWRRALVTGASSGIGHDIATELARRGIDLVVVARTRAALDTLAADLSRAHGVDVEILDSDLTSPADLERVQDRIRSTAEPVDCLVNNAGFGWHGEFVRHPQENAEKQIGLNIGALVDLTLAAVPGMVERGSGGILNVASIGGHVPGPGFAVYSATKAFVVSFTDSLRNELRGSGVHVTTLSPGLTRTGFQERANVALPKLPGFAWTSSADVARAGIAGLVQDKPLVVPGITNRVMVGSARFLPRRLSGRLASLLVPPEG